MNSSLYFLSSLAEPQSVRGGHDLESDAIDHDHGKGGGVVDPEVAADRKIGKRERRRKSAERRACHQ